MSDDGALDVMLATRQDRAALAQKWAEASAAKEAADVAYEAAKLAYSKAEDAEYHAWQALEAMAGRTSGIREAVESAFEPDRVAYVTLPKLPDAHRHSLPQKPIG